MLMLPRGLMAHIETLVLDLPHETLRTLGHADLNKNSQILCTAQFGALTQGSEDPIKLLR